MNQWMAKQILDTGGMGVVTPHIETAVQARNVVQATRYRQPEGAADFEPEGQRGSGAGNAVRFLGVPFADYMRKADVWPLDPAGEIFNLLLIENGEGVKNIAEIVRVAGVSAVAAAPGDLGAYHSGDRAKVERDIQTIVDACKAVRMICGITASAADVERRLAQGFTLLIGDDAMIRAGHQARRPVASAAGERQLFRSRLRPVRGIATAAVIAIVLSSRTVGRRAGRPSATRLDRRRRSTRRGAARRRARRGRRVVARRPGADASVHRGARAGARAGQHRARPAPAQAGRPRHRRHRRAHAVAGVPRRLRRLQAARRDDAHRRRHDRLGARSSLRLPRCSSEPTPGRLRSAVDVKSFDGQVTHFELQNLHWELAMDVLDALPATPLRDGMVGQWYRAVGAYFARERRFADAQRHFDRARGLVPGHQGVLYGEACLQETLGAPRVQDYVRVTTLPNGLTIVGIESPRAHFRRAEALLRKALAADPSFVEARLRLGRVLARQEQDHEALTHLQVAAKADDQATAYYGHLFAGDATQALGRFDDARRHYERAIELFPESQAARLALGSVLRTTGDRAAALTAIEAMLRTPSRGPDDDPWWDVLRRRCRARRSPARTAARAVHETAMKAIVVAVAGAIALQPTFTTRIESVRVDVLVTDAARRPLRGLTAADFVIRDNGVAQDVDVVSFGEISLNVGLAFDLSDSVAGARLEGLTAASQALMTSLQPADQVSLVTFNEVVALPCPLSTNRTCVGDALHAATPEGETSLIDGVLAGMLVGESEVGRSLLMVFSDGLDTASFLGASRVLELGRRSDVVVYPVTSKGARPDFIEELASLTGGRLYEVDERSDLSATFRAILDEFRYRYLVTYTPRGVPRDGWHTLERSGHAARRPRQGAPGYQGR